jgi:thiol-disulfide isomerase/thioredoxin
VYRIYQETLFFNLFSPYIRCGPCLMIAPMYVKLSESNTDVAFYKSDVDEADEVAARCGIQAMPTFQFYKGGVKVDELRGADINQLNALVAQHK